MNDNLKFKCGMSVRLVMKNVYKNILAGINK